jgi:hypothetical protein
VTRTPFPARPSDVVGLTVMEFTRELELHGPVSIDAVCRRFLDDTNRALVWFIRFRALASWSQRSDVMEWLRSDVSHTQRACELAAAFALNEHWEFDADRFRSALGMGCGRRQRAAAGERQLRTFSGDCPFRFTEYASVINGGLHAAVDHHELPAAVYPAARQPIGGITTH